MNEDDMNSRRYVALRDALLGLAPEKLEAFFMCVAPESAEEFDAVIDKTFLEEKAT